MKRKYICEECFEEFDIKDVFWCMAKNKTHQYRKLSYETSENSIW